MANPLFSNFGNSAQSNTFGSFGNLMDLLSNFNQFRAGFQGNPQQMVQNLRDSGKMSDEQFRQFSNMANTIILFIRR